ncbi:CopG family antitoxin [Bartonella sp. DGB2]|uniref:CopG family antitoxin n=1 Tax=Bartonella sp. DGB2 TaxID=3388426 RepID=UPI00398FEEA0
MSPKKLKAMPSLPTDDVAETFVATVDLNDYDLSNFTPMRFEMARKQASFNIRLPAQLLQEVKRRAAQKGLPYSRYVRMLIEEDIAHHPK